MLLRSDLKPDYLYVPTSTYTVRGMENEPSPSLRGELVESNHYRLVYENEKVLIFAVDLDNVDSAESTDLALVDGRLDFSTQARSSTDDFANGAESALGPHQPRAT